MKFELPALPFSKQALNPYISEETIDYHYGKHHKNYVDTLNKLIVGTEFTNLALNEIIQKSSGAIFNNAAQVFNHTFYWNCLRTGQAENSTLELQEALTTAFGGLEKFKEAFTAAALALFGSGWVWLVKDQKNQLSIVSTGNAATPITAGLQPLLTCDLWEHAYYIDYRNSRANYLEAFWQIVNWEAVSNNFTGGQPSKG